MRTTKSVTISLPPAQLKTAERLCKQQSRTMSELFREALRRYEREVEWRPSLTALAQFGKLVRAIQQDSRRAGLNKMSMREINAEVAGARKEMRAKGRKPTKQPGK